MSARVGVLLSGRGSNFLALHRAMESGDIPAEVALVLSNNPDAVGIGHARERGIDARVLPQSAFADRAAQEAALVAALEEAAVDWVCLAGYMRLLSPVFIRPFARRILNIHPSLLPSFPGLHAQRQALDHGVKVTGCTVHLVDEGLDSGPIVVQRSVPVFDDDDEVSLAARILVEEHQAYPEALRRLLVEPWKLEGRRILFR